MKRTIIQIFLTVTFGINSQAQLKVANYACGKPRTDTYEHFAFWTKDGNRTEISYSYGKNSKNVKLRYLGNDKLNGESTFKVQFSNNYVLFITPIGLRLKVTDSAGRYSKTFAWQYEGPVNGIGTYCDVCADDDEDAMKLLKASYLK